MGVGFSLPRKFTTHRDEAAMNGAPGAVARFVYGPPAPPTIVVRFDVSATRRFDLIIGYCSRGCDAAHSV
jgi:hypothetical protein